MPGKQLSRWTMAWFASALVFLLCALVLVVAGAGGPGQWAGGRALAVVHLFVLGWLGQMMLGALVQFAPVLAARPLAVPALALPALGLSSLGTVMLAAGFLSLEEGRVTGLALLGLAPLVLGAALGAAAVMLGGTLMAGQGWRGPEARLVLAALCGMALVWTSGGAMALALSGTGAAALLPAPLLPGTLPLHVLAGAGGWLSLAAFGVSYKLFAMFLLAPEGDGALRRAGFALALAALGLLAAALALTLSGGGAGGLLPAATGAAMGSAALYLAEVRRLWAARRRPAPEVNMQMSRPALGFLALACLLLGPALLRGGVWAEAAAFAALAGWLSLLTLAQMVKIVSFLTWIQCFAPRIGRAPLPMVQDLSDPRATRRWLWLWTGGGIGGTIALLAAWPVMFRLAALALLAAAAGLAAELVAVRRLSHLPAAQRHLRAPLILPPSPAALPRPEIRT
jgi:hypothetical protein